MIYDSNKEFLFEFECWMEPHVSREFELLG